MGKKNKPEASINGPQNSIATLKTTRSAPRAHKKSPSLSERDKASKVTMLRRSSRLRSLINPPNVQHMETVTEHVYLVDSETEEETDIDESTEIEKEIELFAEEITDDPIPNGKSLEEKVDQLVEDVEELKLKVSSQNFSSRGPSPELNYKSLYIRSQKKIEALTNENSRLDNQLQIAQVKVDACENLNDIMKDAIMVSNMTKATDAMVSICKKMLIGFSTPDSGEPSSDVLQSPSISKRCKKGNK